MVICFIFQHKSSTTTKSSIVTFTFPLLLEVQSYRCLICQLLLCLHFTEYSLISANLLFEFCNNKIIYHLKKVFLPVCNCAYFNITQAIIKPQYVDHIPKAVQGNVGEVLEQKDERDVKAELCTDLELNQVIDRNVGDLSGGELQRFAIAVVAIQNAEIYMFDEPSSYLDVKQRLKAAQVIRSLLRPNRLVPFSLSSLFFQSCLHLHLILFPILLFQLCNCCRARSQCLGLLIGLYLLLVWQTWCIWSGNPSFLSQRRN